jgi:hypothetical protein
MRPIDLDAYQKRLNKKKNRLTKNQPRPATSKRVRRKKNGRSKDQPRPAIAPEQRVVAEINVVKTLANSYFGEPWWPLDQALGWIAFREVRRPAITYDLIRGARFQTNMEYSKNGNPFIVNDPLAVLLRALRTGEVISVGPDHKDIPAAFWDGVNLDRRAWPEVRFRREDILHLWPDVALLTEDEGSKESVEGSREGVRQTEADKVKSSKPRMSDGDIEKKLAPFLKRLTAEWKPEVRKFNQDTAKAAAEAHFGKTIDRSRFRVVYRRAGLNQQGGRPRKTPPKS